MGMTSGHQLLKQCRIHGHSFLGPEGIGESLVVNAWRGDGFIDGNIEKEMLKGDLLCCGDNA